MTRLPGPSCRYSYPGSGRTLDAGYKYGLTRHDRPPLLTTVNRRMRTTEDSICDRLAAGDPTVIGLNAGVFARTRIHVDSLTERIRAALS